jgi:hypothetical protein
MAALLNRNPYRTLLWLRESAAARFLTGLAARTHDLSHEALDTCMNPSRDLGIDYLRAVLVAAGCPSRTR